MGTRPRLGVLDYVAIGASCVLVGGAFLPFYYVGLGYGDRFSFGVAAGFLVAPLAVATVVLVLLRLRIGAIIALALSLLWVALELVVVIVLDRFRPGPGAWAMLAAAVVGLSSLAIGHLRPLLDDRPQAG